MLEHGDVLVVRSKTVVGRIIRWVTNSWANHVAVYIGNDLVFEAKPGGAKATPLANYDATVWEYRIFRLDVPPEQKELFIKKLLQKKSRGYDYGQIISIAFKRLFGITLKAQNSKLAICSELVYEAAFEAGIPVPSTPQAYIVPGDFLNWAILVEITETDM